MPLGTRHPSYPSTPTKAGDPVRRGFSILSLAPLEYWIARSSRAMTTESVARVNRSAPDDGDCHCEERSDEAIQLGRTGKLDCFSALAMTFSVRLNDVTLNTNMPSRSRRLIGARFSGSSALLKTEGAGKTGCALHPRSRAQLHKTKRTRAYRFSGSSPAFPARWCYGLLRALPGDRAFLPPSSLRTSQELDASVGASGPHDFAVRFTRVRPARARRPPHPTARFVTIASRPSCRVRRASL